MTPEGLLLGKLFWNFLVIKSLSFWKKESSVFAYIAAGPRAQADLLIKGGHRPFCIPGPAPLLSRELVRFPHGFLQVQTVKPKEFLELHKLRTLVYSLCLIPAPK